MKFLILLIALLATTPWPSLAEDVCASDASQINTWLKEKLKRPIFGRTWEEDNPLFGGAGFFNARIIGEGLQAELISSDRKKRIPVPAALCEDSTGLYVVALKGASVVSKGTKIRIRAAEGNKIHISAPMIDSSFTPRTAF
jgi:hypothetical protein